MNCLIDRSLSGALIKLHTSMLGTFFVYTLAQSIPIFKKKSSQIFLGESCKLCIVVTSKISSERVANNVKLFTSFRDDHNWWPSNNGGAKVALLKESSLQTQGLQKITLFPHQYELPRALCLFNKKQLIMIEPKLYLNESANDLQLCRFWIIKFQNCLESSHLGWLSYTIVNLSIRIYIAVNINLLNTI